MKVILLEHVKKVGKKYDTVTVSPGYARNFLIPRKLARPATEETLRNIESIREQALQAQTARHESLIQALSSLEGKEVTIAAPANEQGHLYAALSEDVIAEALSTASGSSVLPHDVSIAAAIKELGNHTVTVGDGENVASVTISVISPIQ